MSSTRRPNHESLAMTVRTSSDYVHLGCILFRWETLKESEVCYPQRGETHLEPLLPRERKDLLDLHVVIDFIDNREARD